MDKDRRRDSTETNTLGLLRLEGLVDNAALDYDEKHPLILWSLENSSFHKVGNIRLTWKSPSSCNWSNT